MASGGDEATRPPASTTADEDHRANIFEFFRSHNAYDMLPESGKVVLLDSSVSAYSAFCIMSANEQYAVPVWDSHSDQYMGMVTVTDMLELVLMCGNSKVADSCIEGMKEMTLQHWLSSYPRPPGCPEVSIEVHPDDDLMVVLRTLVRNDCRVLPVLERDPGGENLQNCLIGQVSYLLLFRFLYFHQVDDLKTLSESLTDVGIGTFPSDKVVTVQAGASAKDALSLLSSNGISGLPVLNASGMFVDIFCDTDLMTLTNLALDTEVTRALSLSRNGASPDLASLSCSLSDPLSRIISKFAASKSTRLVCLDAHGKIEGIVTLTDLFKFLATST